MVDSFPMVAQCMERQPMCAVDFCACGEEKRIGYWQCPTCNLRGALRRLEEGLTKVQEVV
jgi:hypothetical protein